MTFVPETRYPERGAAINELEKQFFVGYEPDGTPGV